MRYLILVLLATSAAFSQENPTVWRPETPGEMLYMEWIADELPSSATPFMTPFSSGSHIDLSQDPAFPPIRHQGSFNSCVAFAACYYQLGFEVAKDRGWDASQTQYQLSPKFVYNLINAGGNNYTSLPTAIGVMQLYGAPRFSVYPYDHDCYNWPSTADIWRDAMNYRIGSSGIAHTIEDMKAALDAGHPISFGTYIYSMAATTTRNNPSSALDDPYVGQYAVKAMTGSSGGHAMTIVGYNDDIWIDVNGNGTLDSGELGAFKIANSWGTGYGTNGFAWFAYNTVRDTSEVAGSPSPHYIAIPYGFWFSVRPMYEPKMVAELHISHPQRNQITFFLGRSSDAETVPSIWRTMNSMVGGTRPFNGTVALDVDTLRTEDPSDHMWYVGVQDAGADGKVSMIDNAYIVDTPTACEGGASGAQGGDGARVYFRFGLSEPQPNTPPTIASTSFETSGQIRIVPSAYDVDGDPISIQSITGNNHGSVAISGRAFYYTPQVDYAVDYLTVTITDGRDTASATITVYVVRDNEIIIDDNPPIEIETPTPEPKPIRQKISLPVEKPAPEKARHTIYKSRIIRVRFHDPVWLETIPMDEPTVEPNEPKEDEEWEDLFEEFWQLLFSEWLSPQ
jgi:hypothetical protein